MDIGTYRWIDGEAKFDDDSSHNVLLSQTDKNIILAGSPRNLFEKLFSKTLKKYIIDATAEHEYGLTPHRLDTFLSVIMFTMFNKRLSQRDYWSTSPLLRSDPVLSAMGRRKFVEIKSHIKCHKFDTENANDKIQHVRHIIFIAEN